MMKRMEEIEKELDCQEFKDMPIYVNAVYNLMNGVEKEIVIKDLSECLLRYQIAINEKMLGVEIKNAQYFTGKIKMIQSSGIVSDEFIIKYLLSLIKQNQTLLKDLAMFIG